MDKVVNWELLPYDKNGRENELDEIKPPIYKKFMEKNFNVINASTTYTKFKSWIKYAFMTYEIHFHFPKRKAYEQFSTIACNSTIASNKQRQKHINLATFWGANLKGAH